MSGSRLQRRCLAASALLHAGLLAVVVLAPAFRPHRIDLLSAGPPIELVPSALVEAALAPAPAPREQPRETPPHQPDPTPPPVTPPPVTPPVRQPQPPPAQSPRPRTDNPPRPALPETPRPDTAAARKSTPPASKAPERTSPTFDFSKAKAAERPATRAPEPATKAPSPPRWQSLDRQLANAAGSLAQSTTRSTVDVQISGSGGTATRAWQVRQAYDRAWTTPSQSGDTSGTTEVEVVIRGAGIIVNSRILRRSGNAVLDRSVESALRAVQRIQPFDALPDNATVTFTIGFNLQNRRPL
ncbi:MAG: TonB family protein [Verrucomicrobiae bacterium]|nr:TonB family protein [Verrucomicrobiae bacterium]